MSKRIRRRDIELIATELQAALKREATDIIAIGALLIEAQEQLNTENGCRGLGNISVRVRRQLGNYMAAARFAAKFTTVVNLGYDRLPFTCLAENWMNWMTPTASIIAIKPSNGETNGSTQTGRTGAMSLHPPEPPIEEIEAEMADAKMQHSRRSTIF
jgi:hypothetical protein